MEFSQERLRVCSSLKVATHSKSSILCSLIFAGVSSFLITSLLSLTSTSASLREEYFHDFAISISALDGTHQKFVQSPQIGPRSMSATFFPAAARPKATVSHPEPAPITAISKSYFIE